MTLIEIIISYAGMVVNHGRDYADRWLIDVCDMSLHIHISDSVNQDGMLIDATNTTLLIQDIKDCVGKS